jgi:hypothetical protein
MELQTGRTRRAMRMRQVNPDWGAQPGFFSFRDE